MHIIVIQKLQSLWEHCIYTHKCLPTNGSHVEPQSGAKFKCVCMYVCLEITWICLVTFLEAGIQLHLEGRKRKELVAQFGTD